MKMRHGFVSNSSSCSFTITNKTDEDKTLVDFAKETPHLVEDFKIQYSGYKNEEERFNQERMISDAEQHNEHFAPGESKLLVFGDDDGDTIGHVYDYMLRDGGKSKSFTWEFCEMLR